MSKQGETTIMDALGIKQSRHLIWPEAVVILGLAGMFFGTVAFMAWLLLG